MPHWFIVAKTLHWVPTLKINHEQLYAARDQNYLWEIAIGWQPYKKSGMYKKAIIETLNRAPSMASLGTREDPSFLSY